MRTELDCYSCFLRQSLQTARLAGATASQQKAVLEAVMRHLLETESPGSPVNVVKAMQRIVARITGVEDPYREIKDRSNGRALRWIESVKESFPGAGDGGLDTALRISIAGNIIDYGPTAQFDLEGTLQRCRTRPLAIDDSGLLARRLGSARTLAFLADNAGEIVFDHLLLTHLRERFGLERILLVVREAAFLNDALERDALEAGFGEQGNVEILAMGPGKPDPDSVAGAVWRRVEACDVRIAKGQANAESYNEEADFFLLFMVKCDLVARTMTATGRGRIRNGDMVLLHTGNRTTA